VTLAQLFSHNVSGSPFLAQLCSLFWPQKVLKVEGKKTVLPGYLEVRNWQFLGSPRNCRFSGSQNRQAHVPDLPRLPNLGSCHPSLLRLGGCQDQEWQTVFRISKFWEICSPRTCRSDIRSWTGIRLTDQTGCQTEQVWGPGPQTCSVWPPVWSVCSRPGLDTRPDPVPDGGIAKHVEKVGSGGPPEIDFFLKVQGRVNPGFPTFCHLSGPDRGSSAY
jgi:hypothetical protein